MIKKNKLRMNFIERIMVQHTNPGKLALDIVGIVLAVYFFWQNNLFWATVFLFGLSILGTIIAWGKNENHLAQTSLGKFMLGQANPVNLILRIVGIVFFAYGLWLHSPIYIITGVLFVIIARRWKSRWVR